MTAKFRHIIDELNALVTFKAFKSMTDDDFIVNVEAINLLINLHDDLGLDLDRKEFSAPLVNIFPEFTRRIYGKENIQLALPLIKTLNDFIFSMIDDSGAQRWSDMLVEMCRKVVEARRKEPLITSTDYLFALDIVCCMNDETDNSDLAEYKEIISSFLEDIDSVSLKERIKRFGAYERSKLLLGSANWEKRANIREQLKNEDIRSMDDETLLLWCAETDRYPKAELRKRSGKSKQIMLAHLHSQIITEFAKQDRLKNQRKLAKGLKSLNDNIIGDIIPLKIDTEMTVSTLFALETIFYLRLTLAQISDDDSASIYESLCQDRFEKIANVLVKKYPKAATLNEKIEILEHLSILGAMLHSAHVDFAIEESAKLKGLSDLTYAQQLRLDWIPSVTSENESEIVAKLLPEANSSFEMATLALITDYITNQEHEAILNRYFTLLDVALASGNSTEVANLLTLSAYWNSDPTIRQKIKERTAQFLTPNFSLLIDIPLIEKRINDIAATIYSQID